MYSSLHKRNGDPKKLLSSEDYIPLNTKKNQRQWGCDKTKGGGLRGVNCGTVIDKYTGGSNGR